MPVVALDHVNVCTTQLDTMIDWYSNVLSLHKGYRPVFSTQGAWMYAGDAAIVHLVLIEEAGAVGSESNLKLEHFALSATNLSEFEANLHRRGEKFERTEVPEIDTVQYNLWDPDGNHIHVDFNTSTSSV